MYNNINLLAKCGNWRNIRNINTQEKTINYTPFEAQNILALIRNVFMLPDCYDYSFSTKEA